MKITHILILFAAGIVALAISFSETRLLTQTPSPGDSVVEQSISAFTPCESQSATTSSHSVLISSFSLPAPFVLQSHLRSLFLFEIFTVLQHRNIAYKEESSLHPDVFFKIVFRLIISPNAP